MATPVPIPDDGWENADEAPGLSVWVEMMR